MATRAAWVLVVLLVSLCTVAEAQKTEGPTPVPPPTPKPAPTPPPPPSTPAIPDPGTKQDAPTRSTYRRNPVVEKEMREFARKWALDGIRDAQLAPALELPATRQAIDRFRDGSIEPSGNTWLTTGLTFTVGGQVDETRYVPLNLYLEGDAAPLPHTQVTFFGVVENASGTEIGAFENDTVVHPNGEGEVYVDRSLLLDAGDYNLLFGVLEGERVIAMTRVGLTVDPVDQSDVWASDIILSKNVQRFETLYTSTAPFHYGDLLVVPEGDRVFRGDEEMWVLVEVRNVAPKTKHQKFSIETVATGRTGGGVRQFSQPMAHIEGKPLCSPFDTSLRYIRTEQAKRGCEKTRSYLVGQSVPLEEFEAGSYDIEVKILEDDSRASFVRRAHFTVVDSSAARH